MGKSVDEVDDGNQRSNAADIITEIWRRARINAFAHKFAFDEAMDRSLTNRRLILRNSLCSILAVIGVYLVSLNGPALGISPRYGAIVGLILTALSIIFNLRALYLDVISSEENLRVAAAEHEFLLGSYQYIAQRAREAKWPDRPLEELVSLLRDLERDFQLLKARGKEPHDRHFRSAHAVFRDVRSDPVSRSAQSFSPTDPDDLSHDDPRQIVAAEEFNHGDHGMPPRRRPWWTLWKRLKLF